MQASIPTTAHTTCVFDSLPVRTEPGRQWSISAAWVFPVTGPPVPGGSVAFDDSKIVEVRPKERTADWPSHALLPRPVNLHTHWELSACQRPLAPGRTLPEWIPAVLEHRTQSDATATRKGQTESLSTQTSLVVDIAQATPPTPLQGMQQYSFLECLGLSSERVAVALEHAQDFVAADPNHGLSPHAPYSVHPDLLKQLISLANSEGRAITMHLAESKAERELLERASGQFREMLERFGVWDAALFGSRSLNDIIDDLLRAPRAIIAHGNDLRRPEWQRFSANNTTAIAYCPRTHAYFNYGRHPVLEMLEDKVNVGLGTDSRASNPDLSIWNEVLFLRQARPDIPPPTAIELATLNGARALGLERRYGAIAPGFDPNMLVVPLANPDATDPYDALFGVPE